MINRKDTRPVMVGDIQIGGNNNVVIQSMTTTKTRDVEATLAQINSLYKEGCQIVRVAVLGIDDANALAQIVKRSPVPIVADIHFNYKFALIAADAGCAKIRINPGNIGIEENTIAVVEKCREKKIPIRIGVNSGSLPKKLVAQYGWTPKCMVEALREHIEILERLDFHDIIYSLKATDPLMAIEAYTLASKTWKYPAHIGITEAGSLLNGAIKSSFGIGYLLFNGIGSTIRISLSEDPVMEIKVAKRLLNSMGLFEDMVEVIACPTCGRLEFALKDVVTEIEEFVEELHFPLKVAVLGCVVNGPGEASQADIGIAGGNKGGIIFKKGKIFKTVAQDLLVPELKTLILEYYEEWKNQHSK
ncbi:flavodoxin-dependent (E)-4-hydroxy-3-methylbut-2-enyl-diphosphate synthase [Spiroplasma culicicola]|uniref:4-hydroxy-3-methylbut-2-en-1-yl diphosphate synthase (flavodoxin) n=1 Tax=Spiroplasma culicicola AES-1 TaxID=1276246 RepID=W6A696_9MOLU|nr:flavodoxin-dependent (E)-4-hydroxy-3-methylbut-2-enyl-diphosphate synthase [Spiroplasma culicicola]AHI52643.1 4-hydroxy-3-methylbut-2-en-1-yl diphosphate synthase [Spiroplasma culicicola AES-1]